MEKAFDLVQPVWIIIGALIAIFLIILVGFIMTLITARTFLNICSSAHVIRNRSRRNLIFLIAFAYCIAATIAIFFMFPCTAAENPARSAIIFMTLPALVLFWAFLCEAIFECIDSRNRKKSGIRICYCTCCDDCVIQAQNPKRATIGLDKSRDTVTMKEERKQFKGEAKDNLPDINTQHEQTTKMKDKQKSVTENDTKQVTKKEEIKHAEEELSDEELRRVGISRQLAQAEKRERERAEAEKWRADIKEIKAVADAEGDEIRRRKFEEERKLLSVLARDAKAAQFGNDRRTSSYEKPVPRPMTKAPAPIAAAPKPALDDIAEPAAIGVSKPAVITSTAVKPALVTKAIDNTGEQKESRETVVTATKTASHYSSTVTADKAASKTSSKFESLQAKLDLLKKDNGTVRASAEKSEPRGKYDESEVKIALNGLIKSMNANRSDNE